MEVVYSDGEVVVTVAPRGGGRRVRVVTFKADPDFVYRLDRAARRLGLTRSELIREAVEYYLERLGARG